MSLGFTDELRIAYTEENHKYCENNDIQYMESDDGKWLLVHPDDRNKITHLLYVPAVSPPPMEMEKKPKTTSVGVKKYKMLDSEFERIEDKVPGCVVIFKRKNEVLVSVPVDDAERFESVCKENLVDFELRPQ